MSKRNKRLGAGIVIDLQQLHKRILMPTDQLMAEVGGIVDCGEVGYGKRANAMRRYAYRQGNGKVLGVAHCDYVDCGSDHFSYHKDRVWSSRLDDRLGVYVILDLLPKLGVECDVLLTDFEETGSSTAGDFAEDMLKLGEEFPYNWLFQFDRRGEGAVRYDYDEMDCYLEKYFKGLDQGSFSDISLMGELEVCGVNVGTGYHNEHSLGSYANLWEVRSQVQKFVDFYTEFQDERMEHDPYSRSKFYDYQETYRGKIGEWVKKGGLWEFVEDDPSDLEGDHIWSPSAWREQELRDSRLGLNGKGEDNGAE